MLNREELKELAKIRAGDSLFVSLYLNVNPVTNAKNDYMIHLKNILKQAADTLGKEKMKEIAADVGKIESYCKNNKRMFKRGLAIMSASTQDFWKEFHLSIPLKNEVIVDTSPYIKPLLDILDNYQRYAILLVGRDSARLFLVHLGEIEEYAEVRSEGVPRRHKKGGWYALSERSYERHIDYHVSLHLKDVVKALDSFLSQEYVGRVILGGSDEAVPKVREMLPHAVAEKIIGTFQADMQAKDSEILETSEPILAAFEKKKEEETVSELLTKAMKNENAVIGIEDVLHALQEGRVMKLVFLKDFRKSGLACTQCGHLTVQQMKGCPYCKGKMKRVPYLVDLIAQKAVEQNALVEVASENNALKRSGNIGAFLRF
jgi:peptide chain release factor subunit 1